MCQSFILKTKDNKVISGRSMEFPWMRVFGRLQDVWYACKVPSETYFCCFIPNKETTTNFSEWYSIYSYIGLTTITEEQKEKLRILLDAQFDGYFCMDGINQKGLSASALMYDTNTKWSSSGSGRALNVLHFMMVDYILGCYETVQLLRENIKNGTTGIFGFSGIRSIWNHPAHFIVNDRLGDTLIIEVDNESVNCYDISYLENNNLTLHASALNDVLFGQLTNAPNYLYQMNNLRQYLHITPNDPIPPQKSKLTQTSHGTGMLGLPGDFSSPSRFLRLSNILRFAPQPANVNEAIILANHMLNSATIIDGMVTEASEGDEPVKHDISQWVAIKEMNVEEPKLHCRTYNTPPLMQNGMYQTFDFKEFPKQPHYFQLLHQKGDSEAALLTMTPSEVGTV